MKKNNKLNKEIDVDIDIDIDESSELWSFRNKDESPNINKVKELSTIEKLIEKVNKTLNESTQKKHNIATDSNLKYFEEEQKNLDFFKVSIEKELEIFESERKTQLRQKNQDKNNVMNLNITLSELNLGKGVFISKDDLIINLPSNFLTKTKLDDMGNEYQISLSEINRLIPDDDYVAKLHLEYSRDNT